MKMTECKYCKQIYSNLTRHLDYCRMRDNYFSELKIKEKLRLEYENQRQTYTEKINMPVQIAIKKPAVIVKTQLPKNKEPIRSTPRAVPVSNVTNITNNYTYNTTNTTNNNTVNNTTTTNTMIINNTNLYVSDFTDSLNEYKSKLQFLNNYRYDIQYKGVAGARRLLDNINLGMSPNNIPPKLLAIDNIIRNDEALVHHTSVNSSEADSKLVPLIAEVKDVFDKKIAEIAGIRIEEIPYSDE